MNDSFISMNELKKDLNELEKQAINISNQLSLLSQKIKYCISKIKSTKAISDAQNYFDILDLIQLTLATLVFEYEFNIPEKLRNFVTDFDNLEHDKEYLFKKIRRNEYHF